LSTFAAFSAECSFWGLFRRIIIFKNTKHSNLKGSKTNMEEKTYLDQLIDIGWNFGPKVLTALALFFGGWWLIKRLTHGFDIFLRRRKVDESLRPFFTSLTDTGMKVFLVFMVASTVGIETTSFIAVFSAIAFSVGLALQGSWAISPVAYSLLFKPTGLEIC
jgi:small-conductance mechanosensitive channel